MSIQRTIKTHPVFCLFQINDSVFPIGGYTQSYGLETYIQKGIVNNAITARCYLESYLVNNYLFNDLLSVKLSWEYSYKNDLNGIKQLDKFLSASKHPKETRIASIKLGIRFIKIVKRVLAGEAIFDSYLELIEKTQCDGHYSIVYGLSSYLFGICKTDALMASIYNTASSIVVNCEKLVPISQSDGQYILFETQQLFSELIEKVENLNEEYIGLCCTGFDLRAMQHEKLYTRLYVS